MMLRPLLCALTFSGLLVGSSPAWAAFSCPAQDATTGGDMPDLGTMPLSANSPGFPQPLLDKIGRMRADGFTSGRIVDALVPAYCGRVASQAGLTDKVKASQVERFASRLAAFLYRSGSSDEEDILVDVPVPHATFEAMAGAAKRENVSQDAWIIAAIRGRLAQR